VFYFALGFLWGYVWTLLYFQRDLGGLIENLERNKRVTDLIMSAEQSVNEGQLDEAMGLIVQALQNDPKDGRAVLTKGRILKRQAADVKGPERERLLFQALDCANQAIALLPGYGEPIYNKACYQALLNLDKDDILSALKTAFRLDPALKTIARGDQDLKSLWDTPDFASLIATNPATGT
jgi:tetratricopeptide (TPR) repeat protein